jgi:predicted pyridoxine 5'-phosphate oxidase superfamily flavin-nucleotide-binding protein
MTRAISPFHAGEQTIQSLAGVRDRIELKGRAVIRDYMPEQHRAFFAALPFMVVGLADQNGYPWATTLSGPPGFMNSANENLLTINASLDPRDLLHSCIRDGAPVAGWELNFQHVVETESTVASKIASSVKVSR